MEKIVCPLCGSETIIHFFKKDDYDLFSCLNCQLVFVWPIPEGLNKIYNESYYKNNGLIVKNGYSDYDKDKEAMAGQFISYLVNFEKLTTGRKIFDIGTATGYFLDLAKVHGWLTSGSEISEYAVQRARSKGHEVFLGDITELEIDKKFDVITAWDVMEHISRPVDFIKKIKEILIDGGILAINTVNIKSIWAKITGKKWNLIIPPEHLLYYSPQNLRLLLEGNGFEIITIRSEGKEFYLSYIFKRLYAWHNLKFWNKLAEYFDSSIWRQFSIPINLRDNIFIIARKKSC